MDHRIEARIAALEAEISELKKAVAAEASPPTSDRRGMIKLVAATAVGAVTGAAMLGAEPAAAADLLPIVQGQQNDGASATGIHAAGSHAIIVQGDNGVGIVSDGSQGNAWFPGGVKTRPGASAAPGIVWVDSAGDWWGSIINSQGFVTGHPWRKLAGPGTAGQLHVLPVPVRVYDSRLGEAPTFIQPKSPTAVNEIRVITTANLSGVPLSANAVVINLTITGPQTRGFAAVWPSGPWPGTSTINFAAGQDVATTTLVGCGPDASIQVLSNAVTNFLIDVIGYYE